MDSQAKREDQVRIVIFLISILLIAVITIFN